MIGKALDGLSNRKTNSVMSDAIDVCPGRWANIIFYDDGSYSAIYGDFTEAGNDRRTEHLDPVGFSGMRPMITETDIEYAARLSMK